MESDQTQPVPVNRSRPAGGQAPSLPPPPPPPVPRPAPVAAVIPAESTIDPATVAIHTMSDDIKDTKRSTAAGAAPAARGALPRPVPPPAAPSAAVSVSPPAPASAAVFPLPVRAARPDHVLQVPSASRRPGRRLWRALLLVFVLVGLGSAGVAAWFFWLAPRAVPAVTQTQRAPVGSVIPAQSVAIVQYSLRRAEDRTEIMNAWAAGRGAATATLAMAVGGDPRLLVADGALTELFYVILEGTTTPYLVVPKTSQTTALFAASREVARHERDGWYVAHAISTDPYQVALAEAALGAEETARLTAEGPAPLRLHLGAALLPTLRTDLFGPAFLGGQLQQVSLDLQQAAPFSVRLAGEATLFNPLPSTLTNQELLALLPGEATAARLGANFAEDLAQWLAVAGELDQTALRRPVVTQLLNQLTTPYGFFTFVNTDQSTAVGLLIELPAPLKGKLTVDEPALAQGLPALLPLILDRRTIPPVSLSGATYQGVALRFANIVGTSKALDLAVTDSHILVATSKDTMRSLLDTVTGSRPGLSGSPIWQDIFSAWGAVPDAHDLVLARLTTPVVRQLLPVPPTQALPFGIAFSTTDATSRTVSAQGVITPPTLP